MPWGSRAAYSVCSSMKTKLKAPRSRGSTSRARSSIVLVGVVDQQRGDQRGVGGVAARSSPRVDVEALGGALHDEVAQLGRVDEIAVVGQAPR
jgi:hypothetical protein